MSLTKPESDAYCDVPQTTRQFYSIAMLEAQGHFSQDYWFCCHKIVRYKYRVVVYRVEINGHAQIFVSKVAATFHLLQPACR